MPPNRRIRAVARHANVKFRGKHRAVAMAPAFQRLTDNFLAHSFAVRVCVQEVNAGVNRAFYDLDGFSFAGLAAESPASQTDGADLHTGPPKCTIFHPQDQLSPYSNQQGHQDCEISLDRPT